MHVWFAPNYAERLWLRVRTYYKWGELSWMTVSKDGKPNNQASKHVHKLNLHMKSSCPGTHEFMQCGLPNSFIRSIPMQEGKLDPVIRKANRECIYCTTIHGARYTGNDLDVWAGSEAKQVEYPILERYHTQSLSHLSHLFAISYVTHSCQPQATDGPLLLPDFYPADIRCRLDERFQVSSTSQIALDQGLAWKDT